METIIRVQAKDGRGIFNSYFGWSLPREAVRRHVNYMPDASRDFNEKLTISHYCAYPNFTTLQKFLTKEDIQELSKAGFKVMKLKVKECIKAETQVIFLKKDIISRKDITNKLIYSLL